MPIQSVDIRLKAGCEFLLDLLMESCVPQWTLFDGLEGLNAVVNDDEKEEEEDDDDDEFVHLVLHLFS